MSKAEEAWSRAAICVDRAQTARSEETRRFFTRLRDSWVRQANSYQLAESLEAEIAHPARRSGPDATSTPSPSDSVLRRADTRTPVGGCVGLVWHCAADENRRRRHTLSPLEKTHARIRLGDVAADHNGHILNHRLTMPSEAQATGMPEAEACVDAPAFAGLRFPRREPRNGGAHGDAG
jgi:hypothetical protein